MKDAEFLKSQFELVQRKVEEYKCLSAENAKLTEEIERLNRANWELQDKLTSQQDALQQAVEAARSEAAEPLQQQLAELTDRLAQQEEESQRVVEAACAEAAEPLQQQLSALVSQVEAHEEELRRAMDAARAEVAGPLQQQLEELSMQLQNSQAQLERLGEEVEAAEADKAATVQALREENQQLLLALEGAARRMADIVCPPGTLPPGITVSTRLEGHVDLEALVAQQQQQRDTAAASASASAPAEAKAEAGPSSSGDAAEAAAAAPPVQQPQPRQLVRGPTGFLGWLFGVFRFWLFQAVGALLLYYAAAIRTGVPPALNVEFFLGCIAVCTLLSWTHHLLFPPPQYCVA
ncbi:hypothetical protein PLESTF_001525800 [Pleodorina starrii]|nr:hypothetical protein PLESTF_001525800 [Pleodorina starrii]